MTRVRIGLCALALLCAARSATAQTTPLSGLIAKLLLSDITLAAPTAPGFTNHAAHFLLTNGQEVATGFQAGELAIPLALNSTIVAQLSTIPVSSSSGGFSYTFDPSLGTFSRQSPSFGSAFAERALTAGRGRWNMGFNFQRATYDTLEGQNLRNGDIHVYLQHQDCCAPTDEAPGAPPQPFFEGDLIGNSLHMNLTASTFTAYVNYGVTDRLDVGVTVPVVTMEMAVSTTATILRLATAAIPTIHSFDGAGQTTKTFSESGRAQGIGDILLRTKYRFFDAAGGGLGAALDFRLPTGDSEQLLGGGHFQTRAMLIGSMAQGPFSPHVNASYTFSSGKNTTNDPSAQLAGIPYLADEFGYAVGFDVAAHERVTVSADLLGRSIVGIGRLVTAPRTFPYVTSTGDFGTATFDEFTKQSGDLTTTDAAFGVRFNPRGNFLMSLQLLVPLTNAGLRDKITPVIGIDYSF